MDLLCITDASKKFDVSSKTLRYYENVGILKSTRMEDNKYRYYDCEDVERIKQILILRKMQIPIKDIIRIYENENMSTVVEVFVDRINAIDEQVGALSELKNITNEFLQTMLKNGITKISTLPLLYEEMEKELTVIEEHRPISFDDLTTVSEKLSNPIDPAIVALPAMHVISSLLKDKPQESDPDGFWKWLQSQEKSSGAPGQHERFEYQTANGDVIIQHISDDFCNNSPYADFIFAGGLFATINLYIDEDLGERFRSLIKSFDGNKFYEVDYKHEGELHHPAMIEYLISPDDKRELVAMFIPVKKRLADPALFEKSLEVSDTTISEIEAANPVLWETDVPLDKLTPINHPHYQMTKNNEVEYIGWTLTRVLNTNVAVKLPFRVDIAFRFGDDKHLSYGATRNDFRIYHGNHGLDHNFPFSVSMGNDVAISFHQPIFRDMFSISNGRLINSECVCLTWIVGEKHLSCIINGEVCYCGIKFPYMNLDLSREESHPIIIGSERLKYIQKIKVSQLMYTPKNKLKKEELVMVTKQSNNIIPIIHRLVTDEYGENYWFNGCAKYVMECLGEPDYDYWFFAGLTGDIFTQHYSFTNFSSDSASGYLAEDSPSQFYESTFLKCGYAATYVSSEEVLNNTQMYLQTLITYIDKGLPVIRCGGSTGVFVGYEDYGKTLLYITGNKSEPERIELSKLFESNPFHGYEYAKGWIFVGEKRKSLPLAEIYRKAIKDILSLQNVKTDTYCFGSEAFREWAGDIENGKFDRMTAEEFDAWCDYTNYVCVLATNSGCCQKFLQKAQDLNPDFTFLEDVRKQYRFMGLLWNGYYDEGDTVAAEYVKSHNSIVANNLEAVGGGFNITLESLKNPKKRSKIVATIREFADCTDEVARIIKENL